MNVLEDFCLWDSLFCTNKGDSVLIQTSKQYDDKNLYYHYHQLTVFYHEAKQVSNRKKNIPLQSKYLRANKSINSISNKKAFENTVFCVHVVLLLRENVLCFPCVWIKEFLYEFGTNYTVDQPKHISVRVFYNTGTFLNTVSNLFWNTFHVI